MTMRISFFGTGWKPFTVPSPQRSGMRIVASPQLLAPIAIRRRIGARRHQPRKACQPASAGRANSLPILTSAQWEPPGGDGPVAKWDGYVFPGLVV